MANFNTTAGNQRSVAIAGQHIVRHEVAKRGQAHLALGLRRTNTHPALGVGVEGTAGTQQRGGQVGDRPDQHVMPADQRADVQRALRAVDTDLAAGDTIQVAAVQLQVEIATIPRTDMVACAQLDAALLRAQRHQAGGGGQQAAVDHVDAHPITGVQRIEHQIPAMLADAHRTTGVAGKRAAELQVQQRRRRRGHVLADVALGFQRQVAAHVQYGAGIRSLQIALDAEFRVTTHVQPGNRQVIGGVQIGRATGLGLQFTTGGHVQRRCLLDADGRDRPRLELVITHRAQLIDADDLPVVADQLHVTRRGGHRQGDGLFRIELAGEDARVVHVHVTRKAAQVVTRNQLDVPAGDGGVRDGSACGLRRFQRAGADREPQLVVIPLRARGQLAVDVRGGIERELELAVAGLERRLRRPVGAIQFGELCADRFRQTGDVGQHLCVALRSAGGHRCARTEGIHRGCVRNEHPVDEVTVALEVPVLGVAAPDLPLIGRHGIRHAAAIQLQAGADVGNLAIGQRVGIIALRGIQQRTGSCLQADIAGLRDHLAYPEIAVDILQRHILAGQRDDIAATQAIVGTEGLVGADHQRTTRGHAADAAGRAGQVHVAADDGHRVTGDAGDVARCQHADIAIAGLAVAGSEAQLGIGMDVQHDRPALGGRLQGATIGQRRVNGLPAQRTDAVLGLQHQVLRIQRRALVALDDAAVPRFQRGGTGLVVDGPVEIQVVADTHIHAALVAADETDRNRVVGLDTGIEGQVAAGRHLVRIPGLPAAFPAFALRVPMTPTRGLRETEVAAALHHAAAIADTTAGGIA